MTGIWKDASPGYLSRIRERRQLENDLHLATGQKLPDRSDEAFLEMSFDKIWKEFNSS